MTDTTRAIAVPYARHPIHALLSPVPVVCFTGALLTDITYSQSPDMQWANFSAWLLAVGMAFAVLAVVVGLIDYASNRRMRHHRRNPLYGVGIVFVLVLALINNFVHSRDAWTSVVPAGLTLSALTVIAMIVTAFLGRTPRDAIAYRTTDGEIR